MKKFLSIFFALVLLVPCAIALTGCKKDTYKVSSCSYVGAAFTTSVKTDIKWEEKDGKIYIGGEEFTKNGGKLTGSAIIGSGTVVYK